MHNTDIKETVAINIKRQKELDTQLAALNREFRVIGRVGYTPPPDMIAQRKTLRQERTALGGLINLLKHQ